MSRLGIAAGALLLAGALQAAPAVTVKVGADGRLVLPATLVKRLGIRQKRGQLVCVEFPKPPAQPLRVPPGHEGHAHAPPEVRAPRLYLGLGNDGGLAVSRLREPTASGPIPGKIGTVYRATYRSGVLTLAPAR